MARKGVSRGRPAVTGKDELIKFVADKCENVVHPLIMVNTLKEFKETTNHSLSISSLSAIIRKYRSEIYCLDSLSTNTKVKQMFGMGATVNSEYLEELRDIATVEINNKKQIIKYNANDGSLLLESGHSSATNAGQNSLIEDDTGPSTSMRSNGTRALKRNSVDGGTSLVASTSDENAAKKRKTQETSSRVSRGILIDREIKEEIVPNFYPNPRQVSNEALYAVNVQYEDENITMGKHKKLLESIRSIVLSLDLPIEDAVLMRMEESIEKIEECARLENRADIQIDEIYTAINACLLIVTKDTASASDENERRSTSLRDFLMLLRSYIINMDTPALNELHKKIMEIIRDPTLEGNRISSEKIQWALSTIIAIVAP